MAPEVLPPGAIGVELSQTTGVSSNAPLGETQQQRRYQLVHCNIAIIATENMTQDEHFKMVHETRSSKIKKQHAIRCESIHICVDNGQLRIYRTAGVCRELCDQCIASRNGKPPFWTKAFVCTVREIEHYDVISSGSFAEELHDTRLREWPKQALKTLEMATELYMVEVLPGSHFRSSN
jgi:hypothetical protein